MTVTCHQPHFLAWIPYFNKLCKSDLFLVLDDVAYRKNYYQNRTRIVVSPNRTDWLTVPVKHSPLGTPISEILVANDTRALRTSTNRFREAYHSYEQQEMFQTILATLSNPSMRLLDINMELIHFVLNAMQVKKPTVLKISEIAEKREGYDRILTALQSLGANRLIVGMGAMQRANDLRRWEEAGISMAFQSAELISPGSSLTLGDGVSVLHDLLTIGPIETARLVTEFWDPNPL